jgi:hypothetical protein
LEFGSDALALEKLLVRPELHRLARRYMSGEREKQTLKIGALVNEAYSRLIDRKNVRCQNRAHFFAVRSDDAQNSRRLRSTPGKPKTRQLGAASFHR